MSHDRVTQANERVIALLMRLSPQWTEIDTAEVDRLDNACLYLLCGAGLAELRFRGRAWTDQNAVDVEATASGVWIDDRAQEHIARGSATGSAGMAWSGCGC